MEVLKIPHYGSLPVHQQMKIAIANIRKYYYASLHVFIISLNIHDIVTLTCVTLKGVSSDLIHRNMSVMIIMRPIAILTRYIPKIYLF